MADSFTWTMVEEFDGLDFNSSSQINQVRGVTEINNMSKKGGSLGKEAFPSERLEFQM
jgi:hypothetical protein